MTARENEAQLVVLHGALLVDSVDGLIAMVEQLHRYRVPIVARGLPAQAIDRTVPCRRDDPSGRTRRNPSRGPPLDCREKRVLDRLFGDIDVAEVPHENGDGPPVLLAKD